MLNLLFVIIQIFQIGLKIMYFPMTIFVEDNIIKYNFVGTKAGKLIKEIIADIKY